jgi:glutathione synthase/RimK-type ligase-like ATP-grasp enzyme
MQKNQSNMWVCKAIVGRKGEQNSVVSNISSGGKAFRLVEILEKITPLTEENLKVLTEKIKSLAIDICNAVDEYGINCGTLGIDIGIDKKGCLWLIEINNRNPGLSIALDIHDKQLYYTLKTGQLFYAKSLAGFKPD